jgi:hypothetical protein
MLVHFDSQAFLKIAVPFRIERVSLPSHFGVTPNVNIARAPQPYPYRFSVWVAAVGLGCKDPVTGAEPMKILPHDPVPALVGMTALGPLP